LATWLGLVRYHVLFAIDIASRKVEIFGMVTNPGGTWMEQMARNLVDAVDGFLVGKRYLLIDRDTLYTNAFRRILGQGGVKAVRLPARSPNLNAFAERFVLSIKSECLDRPVPLGEAHLRRAILEYTNHYHEERNHQGLDNDLISPAKTTNGVGKVSRRGRLGGLLSFYYREAA
jgi:transposase InsO family protein